MEGTIRPNWSDDSVLAIVSRGDKSPIGKPKLAKPRHCEIVAVIDPRSGYIPDIGEYGRKAYQHIMVPRSELGKIHAALADNVGNLGTTRRTILDIDSDSIAPDAKPADIFSLSRVSLLSRNLGAPSVRDKFLHYQGTKTFGSGGDFALWSICSADADDLTGNLLHQAISDTTDGTGAPSFPYAPRMDDDANGYTITIDLGGYVCTVNLNGDWYAAGPTNSGTVILRNGTIKRGSAVALSSNRDLVISSGTTVFTLRMHRLILNGDTQAYSRGCTPNSANMTFEMWNCIVANMAVAGALIGTNASNAIESCVFSGCANGVNNNSKAVTYRNCAFVSNTANVQNATNSVSLNCATNKVAVGAATDTSPQVSLVSATEYQSTSLTGGIPYKLARSSVKCKRNGTTAAVASHTVDYGNRALESTPSIGPWEWGPYSDENGDSPFATQQFKGNPFRKEPFR